MKNTGLIIALGVVSGIAVAATVALSTKVGRDAAEKATGKVKEVSGKAYAKTKEVSGKVVSKVISKVKKNPVPAIEATCEEVVEEVACEACEACEAAVEETAEEAVEEVAAVEEAAAEA